MKDGIGGLVIQVQVILNEVRCTNDSATSLTLVMYFIQTFFHALITCRILSNHSPRLLTVLERCW